MPKIKFLLSAIVTLFLINCFEVKAGEIPQIEKDDFADVSIRTNNVYDGNALWGYMNGAADLYLEYGFSALRVQELVVDGIDLKLEIYQMENPEAAFGIFSIKRFRCTETGLYIIHDCLTGYQYQAAMGHFYLSLINFSGNAGAVETTKRIAAALTKKIEDAVFLPVTFDQVDPNFIDLNELKWIKGKLGLQNGISKWVRLFDDFSGYTIYYLPVSAPAGGIFFADICFNSSQNKDDFVAKIFDTTNVFPAFQTLDNKTFGMITLTDTCLRIVEINGKKSDFLPVLSVYGF
jgi:hypothetical protein